MYPPDLHLPQGQGSRWIDDARERSEAVGDFQTGPPTLAIDFSFIRTVLSMPQRSTGSRCRSKMCDWRHRPQASKLDRKKQRTGARILRSGATMPFVIESNTHVDVEYQVLTAASPVSI
jgi:hypothetical protein